MFEHFLEGTSLITIAKTIIAFAPMILPAAAGGTSGYQIARSLRFRASNSGNLSRTLTTPTNQKIFTFSTWVKRSGSSTYHDLINSGSATSDFLYSGLNINNVLDIQGQVASATVLRLTTNMIFRDPSAWYHLVFAIDTTQATAANRAKLYCNGVEITSFSTATYPAQNTNLEINKAIAHYIGRSSLSAGEYFDGYFAETIFIDGQQLTPSSFGATDVDTGAWNPKAYTGTYGTNGFKLNFSDNSAATASTIGADSSGNGNNWTPSGISITAGVTNDSFVDSPTNYGSDTGVGGEVRGNYCTLQPTSFGEMSTSLLTHSDGNLVGSQASGASSLRAFGSWALRTGKWYFEAACNFATPGLCGVGFRRGGIYGFWVSDGSTVGLTANPTLSTFANGDILGCCYDADAGTVRFYKNGTVQGTGDYAVTTGVAADLYPMCYTNAGATSAGNWTFNFGQRAFAYTAPSGYKCLCTQNLPDPAIKKPSQYFDVALHAGTGSALSVTGFNLQPDLIWLKARNAVDSHLLVDSVRGGSLSFKTDTTGAEVSAAIIDAFLSNGFTAGANVSVGTRTYVDWMWKKGVTPGFDIVTFTGTGANATIAHSLGVAPKFMIVKGRSVAQPGIVWHSALSGTQYLNISGTGAAATDATVWNSTVPSSSVFSLGSNAAINTNGGTFIAYLWAEVPGFSKFGSYTGNGNVDGPFVNCGFRPRWIMVKRTDSTGNWFIKDSSRSLTNPSGETLLADLSDAEYGGGNTPIDFLSNGFKLRLSGSINTAGTYIYAAFAENPFKYARAR